MLNPLNIAPASGQAVESKPDPLTSRNSEKHQTARGDDLFESVLVGESEAAQMPEDATTRDAAIDGDHVPDKDEVADYDPLPDQDGIQVDADEALEALETIPVPDADSDAQYPVDEGRLIDNIDEGGLIADQDDFGQNVFAAPDNGLGRDNGRGRDVLHSYAPNPRDAVSYGRVFPRLGNDGLPQDADYSRPHLLKNFDAPQITGLRHRTDQTGLTHAIIADTPQLSSGLQAADDISPSTGVPSVHSLLGVALNQQASGAIAEQNDVQKNAPVNTRMIEPDPDQPSREKVTGENSQPVLRPASVAGQAGLTLAPLAPLAPFANDRISKTDAQDIIKRIKTDTSGAGQHLANPGAKNTPVMPSANITTGIAAGPAPAIANLSDIQLDTGRVNWISETGVLSDTGTISDTTAPVKTSLDQIFRNPDLPRHLASQIASVAQRGGAEKPVELLLNPIELGRVKISMVSVDGAMNVSVIAERPETLDLMRRHIDVLAREFLDIGYDGAAFTFGQNSPGSSGDSDHPMAEDNPLMADHPDEAAPVIENIAAARIITDRVDIRL